MKTENTQLTSTQKKTILVIFAIMVLLGLSTSPSTSEDSADKKIVHTHAEISEACNYVSDLAKSYMELRQDSVSKLEVYDAVSESSAYPTHKKIIDRAYKKPIWQMEPAKNRAVEIFGTRLRDECIEEYLKNTTTKGENV